MTRSIHRAGRVLAMAGLVVALALAAGGLTWAMDGILDNQGKVQVEAPVPATVIVDGRIAGAVPQWLELDPGTHRVEVRAPGYRSYTTSLDVPGHGVQTVYADLRPVDARARIIAHSQGSLPRPQWAPDGSALAMVCDWERVVTFSLAENSATELARHQVAELAIAGWSPDGAAIAYEEYNGPGQWYVDRAGRQTAVNAIRGQRVRWAPGLRGALVVEPSGVSWHAPVGNGFQPPAGRGLIVAAAPVSDALVSPDGRFAAVVETLESRPENLTMCGDLYLVDLATGSRRPALGASPCQDLARIGFSPSGRFLVALNGALSGGNAYDLAVVDLASGAATVVDQVGLEDSFSQGWSAGDEWLVYSVGGRDALFFWNSATGATSSVDLPLEGPAAPAFLGDRQVIVCARGVAGDRFNVDLWEVPVHMAGDRVTAAAAPRQIGSGVFEPSLTVSPAGDAAAFTTSDGAVWVWRP